MKLSIIIPIYNEEKLIKEVLRRVRQLPFDKEIILVDDASIDGTHKILEQEVAEHPGNTILLTHKHNRGKGASIRTGLQHATGDIIIIQDADLEYNPEEIPAVIKPILEGKTNVAYGSRFLGEVKRMRLPNLIANKILALLVSVLYGQRITDEATAYKAFRREVIQQIELKCTGFEFCPEVTAKLLRKGEKIIEVPVTFTARTFWEGKKIGWRDFFIALYTLIKYRFFR
ncbi:glycosyltransferase family 2 protein [Candidatus Sumerlaeota bacterium]|nr:glycosyltransferase family 2 protein [Candidatus Sumerlaeota bacterium]